MEKQLPTKTNYQDNHWLNIVEGCAVVGSIGGTVASILLGKMFFLASVPLSTSVALNLINRKRLFNLATIENDKAIAQLTQHNQNDLSNLGDRQTQHDSNYQQLQSQYDELASKITKLTLTQTNVSDSSSSAKLYYQKAIDYEQMGEKLNAIEEYTKAIEIDSGYAEAYSQRGLLYSDTGSRKAAVEDLRKAAKLYFEQGDLDNYQKSKNMTQEIHQSDSTSNGQDSDQVLASGLFS